jgi:DNA (cytosine-5)-methyltransferase 1
VINVLDLFSGIGGFSLGLERTGGFRTVAFCEIDPFCRSVLAKHWSKVPIYEDVRKLTADALAGSGIVVDVICGGFPCQDASVANTNGAGTKGQRTALFSEAVRLAREMGAALLMENVPGLFARGFGDVLGLVAAIGYDAEWECVSAAEGGAPHKRERLFVFAYPRGSRWQGLVEDNGLLVPAREAFAQHGHAAFNPWRSLVDGEPALRGGDGVSLALERRRLGQMGNSVAPPIVFAQGLEIMKALRGGAA